jgi:hypothetical protein
MSYVCEIEDGAEEAALVRALQLAIFQHPIAAQAVFAALVAEGRRFATTEEGKLWEHRLASSTLLTRGRKLWDVLTLNALDDNPSSVLPSRVVDAFVKLVHDRTLEDLVARMYGSSEGRDP